MRIIGSKKFLPNPNKTQFTLVLSIVATAVILGVTVISYLIYDSSVRSIRTQVEPLTVSISKNVVASVQFRKDFPETLNKVNYNSFLRGEISLKDNSFDTIVYKLMAQMYIASKNETMGLYTVLRCNGDDYCISGVYPADGDMRLWLIDESTGYKRFDVLTDEEGSVITSVGGGFDSPSFNIKERPWFQVALDSEDGSTSYSEPYQDVISGEWCISIMETHFDDDSKIGSVFVVDIELKQFSDTLNQVTSRIESEEGIQAFVIDKDERLFSVSDKDVANQITETKTHLLTISDINHHQMEFGMEQIRKAIPNLENFPVEPIVLFDMGLDYVVATEKVSDEWAAIVVVPRGDFYSYVAWCRGLIIIITAIVLLGIVCGVKYINHRIWLKKRKVGPRSRSYSVIGDQASWVQKGPKNDEDANWNIVVIVIGTFIALCFAYIVWYFAVLDAMDQVVSKLTNQIQNSISNDVTQYTKSPFDVIKFNTIAYNTGFLRGKRDELNNNEFYKNHDRLFYDRMHEASSPTYVFTVNDEGVFQGVQTRGDFMIVGALDDSTSNVYMKMNFTENAFERDFESVVDYNTSYRPTQRPYYIAARERPQNVHAWSSIYLFTDGSVGATLTCPYDGNQWNPPGVFAVDITLKALSTYLADLDLGPANSVAYVMDRDGLMIASSKGMVSSTGCSGNSQLVAGESDNSLVSRSFTGLQSKVDIKTLGSFSGTLWRGNTEGELWVEVKSITTNSLDWIMVIAFEKSDFFDDIETRMDRAFLMGMGVIAISVYFTAIMAMAARSDSRKKNPLGKGVNNIEFFESSRTELKGVFQQTVCALVDQGELKTNVLNDHIPSPKEEKLAYHFIIDGSRDINILDTLHFLTKGWKKSLYALRFRNSPIFKSVLNVIMGIHLLLIFAECPDDELPLTDLFSRNDVLMIEGGILLFHVFDLIIMGLTNGFRKAHMTMDQRIETVPNIPQLLRIGFIACMLLDWIFRICVEDYTWKSSALDINVPYTVVLRPLLLVVCNPNVMAASKSFVATLFFARDVFILFMCFLVTGSVLATILIDSDFYEFGKSKIRGFADSRASFLTMFVFLTSAENYPDVVHPPASHSYWYQIFFVFFSMIGMFLLSSLVIAIFETKYSDRHGQADSTKKSKRRLAYIAAFIALDKDNSGRLTPMELTAFMGNELKFVDECFTLNIIEFVELIEQTLDKLTYDSKTTTNKKTKFVRRRESTIHVWTSWFNSGSIMNIRNQMISFYSGVFHRRLMLFFTILYMWVLSLYGTYTVTVLDNLCILFMVLYAIEMCGRIFAFGWSRYWNRPSDVYTQMANRYDFFVALVSFAGFFYSWFIEGNASFDEVDPKRVALAIPIFRIFSVVDSIKVLFFAMLNTVKVFTDVGILLIVVFYEFGALGVVFFGGRISQLDESTYRMLSANFDSMLKAIGTLFQLMVGASWSQIMYAGIDAVGMMSMVYFILWTVIISLLFTNLIVGIVCNSFEKVDNLRQEKGDGTITTREMSDALHEGSLGRMLRFLQVRLSANPAEPVELIRTQHAAEESRHSRASFALMGSSMSDLESANSDIAPPTIRILPTPVAPNNQPGTGSFHSSSRMAAGGSMNYYPSQRVTNSLHSSQNSTNSKSFRVSKTSHSSGGRSGGFAPGSSMVTLPRPQSVSQLSNSASTSDIRIGGMMRSKAQSEAVFTKAQLPIAGRGAPLVSKQDITKNYSSVDNNTSSTITPTKTQGTTLHKAMSEGCDLNSLPNSNVGGFIDDECKIGEQKNPVHGTNNNNNNGSGNSQNFEFAKNNVMQAPTLLGGESNTGTQAFESNTEEKKSKVNSNNNNNSNIVNNIKSNTNNNKTQDEGSNALLLDSALSTPAAASFGRSDESIKKQSKTKTLSEAESSERIKSNSSTHSHLSSGLMVSEDRLIVDRRRSVQESSNPIKKGGILDQILSHAPNGEKIDMINEFDDELDNEISSICSQGSLMRRRNNGDKVNGDEVIDTKDDEFDF